MDKAVKFLLALFALGVGFTASPALADETCSGGGQVGMVIGGTSPNCVYLKVNPDGSISVNGSAASAATAVAGTQRGLSIASATSLTVPATATLAIIEAQGTNNTSGVCLFWQDDGTSPTGIAGQSMAANQTMSYSVSGLPIKLIAATGATCTATISYYK